jgi:NADH-quinone oxidoreductase subunit L
MKDMGGLRKFLPITHVTFLIACLAISGIWPFAGFFSKEEILLAAYQNNTIIYYIALITSGLTAFYMFRLYFSIFWNKPYEVHREKHGEGGFSMMMPLILLAIGAAAADLFLLKIR